MTRESRAPLIVAIVLLLLPVLYVGSYLVLVAPQAKGHVRNWTTNDGRTFATYSYGHYRWIDDRLAGSLFWPLEQVDQGVRTEAWKRGKKYTDGQRGLERPLEELTAK
jgi:hypothetical protein